MISSDDIGLSEYDNLCKNFLNTEKTIWVVTNIYYALLISMAGFIIKMFDELDWVLFLIIPIDLIIVIVIFHLIFRRLGHVNIVQKERIRELEIKVGKTLYMTVDDKEDERYLEKAKHVLKLEFMHQTRERRKHLTTIILSTWSIFTLIWAFLLKP